MLKTKRINFKVSLVVPPGATIADVREFIDDAVACWAGQCRPDGWDGQDSLGDPMHRFDNKTLRVTQIRSR